MEFDVVVIGAGVCGIATALSLAETGAKVAVLEKGEICSGASSTNPGFCVLSYREDAYLMQLALDQQKQWVEFAARIGCELEYKQKGGLIILNNQEESAALEQLMEKCRSFGLKEIEMLNSKKTKLIEPYINEKAIVGSVYCQAEGMINPFKLNIAMADYAKKLGVEFFLCTQVNGFEKNKQEITLIKTNRGNFKSSLVVLAAGAWTSPIIELLQEKIPVFFDKGEAMVSMQVDKLVYHSITDGGLFIPSNEKMVIGACLGQTNSGNIVLAQATTKTNKYDTASTPTGMSKVAEKAVSLFPKLAEIDILRMWSGLIAYTQDRKPVFGFMNGINNLLIIAGFHSAIGISPKIGALVAEYYMTGKLQQGVLGYSPKRFDVLKKNDST